VSARDRAVSPFYWTLAEFCADELLPFVFACYLARKYMWRAAIVLVLLTLYYPITLSKVALFTPVWLLFFALLSRIFEAKMTVILSLLVPLAAGLTLLTLFRMGLMPEQVAINYFGVVNFRMAAIPSNT